MLFRSGSTFANRASSPFRVNAQGDLTATSATITGNITATSGDFFGTVTATDIIATGSGIIGGFSIDANTISTTGLTLGKSGQTYAINAGSGNFTVDHSGNLYANSAWVEGDIIADHIRTTSGSIGG